MMPRLPSEPRNRRSGDGPAPEPGRRRDSLMPVGRDDPQRLDEVVDVRVHAGVVAAGAGRQPAAERRQLERLREVAQRVAVRAELLLEHRSEGAGLDPRRPRHRVDLEHPVEAAEIDRDDAGEPVTDGALDAADDRRAAAVGDRRDAGDAHQSSTATTSASVAGKATTSGGCRQVAVDGPHDVPVRLAVRVPGPVAGAVEHHSAKAAGGATRGARSSRSATSGGSIVSTVAPEALGQPPGRRQHLVVATAWSS